MKNLLPILGLALAVAGSARVAANPAGDLPFSEQISNQFLTQVVQMPQEKLYLHTDKPYYSAGEKIWFEGYLLNAVNHTPTALSKFIYVELIDRCDSVFQRVKVRNDSLGFAGTVNLPSGLPLGYYTLRAYTNWMRNTGEDFFFRKSLFIGNPLGDKIASTVTYGKPKNGFVTATLVFLDNQKKPLVGEKVESRLNWTGPKKNKATGVTDKNGSVSFQIPLDTLSSVRNKIMEVTINGKSQSYSQRYSLPALTDDFDVQFFPEGGNLLANCLQTVAFKAIGSNGLSLEVSGDVVDSKGEECAQITTLHKGMGKFILNARAGETYYANVKTTDGKEKRIPLVAASGKGVTLQLKYNRGRILYEISNTTALENQSLSLLIHCRGNVLVVKQLDSLSMSGMVPQSSLPTGIVSFSVWNRLTGQSLSERLSFVSRPMSNKVAMSTDKPAYSRREDVNLTFSVLDKDSIPADGKFSLSVTDAGTVVQDTLADNMLTNILLTSDLKGYIEDPAAYFTDSKTETQEKLDLLMLTQGWKRFNPTELAAGKLLEPKYPVETGQALTGKVYNLLKKPVEGAEIFMITPAEHKNNLFLTDKQGRFAVDSLRFQDSTRFIFKVIKQKSLSDVEILPDPDDFAPVNSVLPTKEQTQRLSTKMTDYFDQSKEKYYIEGGISPIQLKEVTVTTLQKKKAEPVNYYTSAADQVIGLEKLAKMHNKSLFTMLYTLSGVTMVGNRISIRGNSNMPLVLFDNRMLTGGDLPEGELIMTLKTTTSEEIEELAVFQGGNAAIFGMQSANGVIAITSRKGGPRVIPPYHQINLACVYPLGYQKPSEFYVPKYEVNAPDTNTQPDLRTTLYWNPSLTGDENGQFSVRFPSADKSHDYNVELEGVTSTGEVVRYTGRIKRR